MAACKSCGMPIQWAKSAATGSSMPVDTVENETGNIELTTGPGGTLLAHVITDPDYTGKRYASHFQTCPNANQHRRKGGHLL